MENMAGLPPALSFSSATETEDSEIQPARPKLIHNVEISVTENFRQ